MNPQQRLQQLETLSGAELKAQLEQVPNAYHDRLPLLIVAGWKLAAENVDLAEAHNAEARNLCKRHGLTGYDALLMRNEAHCLYNRSQYTQALVLFEQAETHLERPNSIAGRPGLLDLMIAMTHLSLDNDEATNQRAQRALAVGEATHDTYIITRSLTILGAVAGKHDNHDMALNWFQRCLLVYEADGETGRMASALHNISRTHFALGNYAEALAYAEKALAHYEQVGQRSGAVYVYSVMGDIFAAQNDDEAALRCYARALAVSEEMQRPTFALDFHRKIAEIKMGRGALDEAIAGYLRALDTATEGYEAEPVSDIHRQLARCYEQTGDLAAAMRHLREHLRLQEKLISAETEARLRHEHYTVELALQRREIEVERLKVAEAQRQLEHADRLAAIGKLAAGIAHEINNPLQVIYGNMALLAEGALSPQQHQEAFQSALLQLQRVSKFVEHLRGLYQRESREPEVVALAEPVRRVAVFVQKQLQHKGIRLVVDLADETALVTVSETHLQQVVLNLILNASDAMPGGGTLHVRSGIAPADAVAWVEVIDSGPGIPPETLAHVFEPFYTTRQDGSGLGLAICQNIMKHYGGDITLTSTVGQGTTARVTLPLSL